MKRLVQLTAGTAVLALSVVAFAQASELRKRMQDELDSWRPEFVSSCGTAEQVTFKFDGKIDSDPRAVSELCKAGFEGAVYTCRENEPVKKVLGKVTAISCARAAGPMGYKLAGGKLSITVDPAYDKKTPSGQRDDLVTKLKAGIDR